MPIFDRGCWTPVVLCFETKYPIQHCHIIAFPNESQHFHEVEVQLQGYPSDSKSISFHNAFMCTGNESKTKLTVLCQITVKVTLSYAASNTSR